MRIYLLGDVDAIKSFVFETSSLPQIRGGSQLLVECEAEINRRIQALGGREIYCSGGSFLFEVPVHKAAMVKKTIETLYLDRTLVATVTVVYEQELPNLAPTALPQDGWARRLWMAYQQAQQSSNFAQRMAFLNARMRETKSQKHTAPFLEAFPFGRRCEACGKRIAQEEISRREPEQQDQVEMIVLCPVCLQRHKKGAGGRAPGVRGCFNERFYRQYAPTASQPPDLDHLVKSARRKYVAFLYADGNDIGQLLQKVRSEEEFAALSQALEEGTEQALFQALQQVCAGELRNGDYWPFEIVNVGGDDVTLLIQAGYAWEVAVQFLERFEAEVTQRMKEELGYWPEGWPEKITASCGIAIADVKYPVRYLEYLASDLLKGAKREAKADRGHPRSAVTFLWLPNPIAAEKAQALMSYYQRNNSWLTVRPYTLSRARELTSLVREASQWSRALRHRWGEALDKGMWVSLNTVYYDVARQKEDKRAQLVEFLEKIGQLGRQREHRTGALSPLWQVYKEEGYLGWRTALLDVLELAELRATRPDVEEGE